ncbi:hypothetical protein QEJ31_04305 [Pigmentibacter sp. JX0631]|uniref:hypothetical protein n=1 Tax=Pigmentibacter sp. JX0631 TaxID=2976982 RepID=UPI00246898E7|nr:hypothetical protein [Pigmentibacter sp. JX0631]WGL60818.1 hypothetical protein QEJ31_04305 [Pigmentibacter sp. JX0631]
MDIINLERQIKKNIYGKPQTAKLFYPPGFGETAKSELSTILANLWYPQNTKNTYELNAKYIDLKDTHISVLMEIILRTKCLSDVHLVLTYEKCHNKDEFRKICSSIKWNYYLEKNLNIKIKVNSTASKAFHESSLKEIANEILSPLVNNIYSGEKSNEDTVISFELYKDKLTTSISLAGQPLYKRGYKKDLKTLAPLREDLAACCIQKFFNTLKQKDIHNIPDKVYVPFAGSGTLAFETHFYLNNINNHYFEREYVFMKLPFFKKENYNFLIKKSSEIMKTFNDIEILCIDTAESAVKNNLENIENYLTLKNQFSSAKLNIKVEKNDFFQNNSFTLNQNFDFLFIPLNPPYGLRIQNKLNSTHFYQKIAQTLNQLNECKTEEQKHIGGFILCPTEEAWSSFLKTLKFNTKDTYHFTQGGLDIRVCQFYS